MGIITEYIKALGEAIKHPQLVIEGWINDAKLNRGDLKSDEMAEVLRRRAICEECPFFSVNAVKDGNYITQRQDPHCIQCGCPIAKKTASLESSCGIEIYNRKNKDNQIPLKWGPFIKFNEND